MVTRNLPSRFVKTVPTQAQIDEDKSGTKLLLNHLIQSFNLFREREKYIQTSSNNDPDEVIFTQDKLLQIADMIEYILPGTLHNEVAFEASQLRNELRELEIKKSALINKIIKLGSYTS